MGTDNITYYADDAVHPDMASIKAVNHMVRMGTLTETEAEFEREISRSVIREVAKLLGYEHVPFMEDEKLGGTLPFIVRIFGECLIIPGEKVNTRLTVTYWQGSFNADVVVRRNNWKPRDNNIFSWEGSVPADDPALFEKIAAYGREGMKIAAGH